VECGNAARRKTAGEGRVPIGHNGGGEDIRVKYGVEKKKLQKGKEKETPDWRSDLRQLVASDKSQEGVQTERIGMSGPALDYKASRAGHHWT
jgi:hypothetical protein